MPATDPERAADTASTLDALNARIVGCRACPRLVSWREQVASDKRRSFAGDDYWGRPVPSFGAIDPAVLIVGLAPAAHGANRTGRMFTGDRSGDWLYASLHRVGLATQPTSTATGDGLRLIKTRVTAAVRCAPPENKPTPLERQTCSPWLHKEFELTLPSLQAVVALGSFAWRAVWEALAATGVASPRPRPAFGHGVSVRLDGLVVLASYHPSQQNTFTGRLTEQMLDDVLGRAAAVSDSSHADGDGRSLPGG